MASLQRACVRGASTAAKLSRGRGGLEGDRWQPSHLPAPLIEVIRRAMRGETFVSLGERLLVARSLPNGHVQAVRTAMR